MSNDNELNHRGIRYEIVPNGDVYYARIENPSRHGFWLIGPWSQLAMKAKWDAIALIERLLENQPEMMVA